MKKNKNWINLNSKYNLDYILLGVTLLFCFAYRIFYFGILNPNLLLYNSDSITYFTADFFDLYRTPVYPTLLKSFEFFSKDNYINHLVFFQQVISFLSIIPFFYCAKKIVKNSYITVVATITYGCWHYLLIQNVNLNPECLTITGSTLILFLFVKYVESPNRITVALIAFTSLILIMLKPTYLILLFIIIVFLIARLFLFKQEKKILYWGFLSWFISVLVILGYCEMNSRLNGNFVLSKITLNNAIANVILSDSYKHGDDKELIEIIDSAKNRGVYNLMFLLNNEYIDSYKLSIEKFPSFLPLTDNINYSLNMPDTENFSYARLVKFVNKSRYSTTYLKFIIQRSAKIILNLRISFFFIICELALIFYAYIKHRKIPWALLFSIVFVIGQLITIIIGGIGDRPRLLIPSYPLFIIIIASFFNIFISSLDRDKLIKSVL